MAINTQALTKWLKKQEVLETEPAAIEPRLKKLPGIKALIFDVFGTLLISSFEKIGQNNRMASNLRTALAESGYFILRQTDDQGNDLMLYVIACFLDQMKRTQHRFMQSGQPSPEVDVRNVWQEVISQMGNEGILSATGNSNPGQLAFTFDLLNNKAWPMQGMMKLIEFYNQKQIPLGIVSNAQFYTPVMMNYFISGKVEGKDIVDGFDPDISVFSYQLHTAKPDLNIFRAMLTSLKSKFSIHPEEAVFIGNDIYKDIFPAAACGMKTILFAGDRTSLRLRQDKEEVAQIQPDAIVTHLEQIFEIISLSPV